MKSHMGWGRVQESVEQIWLYQLKISSACMATEKVIKRQLEVIIFVEMHVDCDLFDSNFLML